MPEADGKITVRLSSEQSEAVFWAIIDRMHKLVEERRDDEIVTLGTVLAEIPTYQSKGK